MTCSACFTTNSKRGFTLIEVLIAVQIVVVVLTLFAMFYIYLINEWNSSIVKEERLLYERHFLYYLSKDIQSAVAINKEGQYLYVHMEDGVSYRYHHKPNEKRIDVGTKQANQSSYYGRITAGVAIDALSFDIYEYGVGVRYQVHGSDPRERFYRTRFDLR